VPHGVDHGSVEVDDDGFAALQGFVHISHYRFFLAQPVIVPQIIQCLSSWWPCICSPCRSSPPPFRSSPVSAY
ncbi:MAG: hypothetical protein RR749_11145, partial [Comamonas sp.]